MKQYYSIGETAKMVGLTSETLRHYDRIGLVQPGKKDEWTKYRYYTEQDIVRLNTVKLLQVMDLSLKEIKKVLDYDELEKIVDFLMQAEKKADEKIAAIQYSKSRIQLARQDYENKILEKQSVEGVFTKDFPERIILLSDTLEAPALDHFWNYLSHFYELIAPPLRKQFSFEDIAGIYTENGLTRLFALCIRFAEIDGIKTLPAGTYLCADCNEENREIILQQLVKRAKTEYHADPVFTVQIIVISGILRWNYQVQVYLGDSDQKQAR